jgi:hypothetical protein
VNGRAMSALIPLRLIYLRCGERRFVPLADSCSAAAITIHAVAAAGQGQRDGNAKRASGRFGTEDSKVSTTCG